ncbi:PREDICTED: protein O-GlcNAcase-like [Sturnus vulgaris]|uniref:protein O-GlcNAcase-like n=1 Tax=Sturnus vulgaris TaxID=9172 RepID=UPI000719F543|nr:PREDICTED: protein O-GlcNAcase-like [Sturnus vulgaris]
MAERPRFLCGVVEGFYGRPWSMDQRKLLFQWLQRRGLNCYMYAPKDELKHRLLWREPYTEHEAARMRSLIEAAQEQGVEFIFAISAGQDMVFSSAGDRLLLQQKLRQVAAMGCRSFALLFDDIDPCMCQADRDVFPSLAQAQASVANEVYQELGQPSIFLFCPTEYCSSLCSPSPSQSCYLQTIGQELLPGIGVIWTGPKVVSQELSAVLLEEVEAVLRRCPVIWDNLYANDYDCRRVFLGPYMGRAPGLMSRLHGLLLNPNCELQANFIPIHTLGTWFQSELGSCAPPDHAGMEEVTALGDSQGAQDGSYSPQEALELALRDWVAEINQQALEPGIPVATKILPSPSSTMSSSNGANTSQNISLPTSDARTGDGSPVQSPSSTQPEAIRTDVPQTPPGPGADATPGAPAPLIDEVDASPGPMAPVTPEEAESGPIAPLTPKEATTSPTAQVTPEEAGSGSMTPKDARTSPIAQVTPEESRTSPLAPVTPEESGSGSMTPKEARTSPTAQVTPEEPRTSPLAPVTLEEAESGSMTPKESRTSPTSQVTPEESRTILTAPVTPEEAGSGPMALMTPKEARPNPTAPLTPEEAVSSPTAPLTLEEVRMLVELFYLPYHHGALAQQLLEHFRWLRANSLSVGVPPTAPDPCGGTRWRGRAQSFQLLCARTCRLHSRFVSTASRALLYDLHPYLWDIRNMLLAACAFVLWLGTWLMPALAAPGSPHHTFPFPGMATSSATLTPRAPGGTALAGARASLPQSCWGGTPSPGHVVGASLENSRHCCPWGTAVTSSTIHPHSSRPASCTCCAHCCPWTRLLGSFLSLSPEYTFVLEDEGGPCGYAAGALHAEGFLQKRDSSWLPAIRHKYPPDLGTGGSALGQDGRGGGGSLTCACLLQDALEEAVLFFHTEPLAVPQPVLRRFPSLVQLGTAPRVLDVGASRSLALCLLSALRANGSRGVFCQVSDADRQQLSFYSKLGFVALPVAWGSSPGSQLLGRLL